jgi:uncharacterized protein (DUF433 family)
MSFARITVRADQMDGVPCIRGLRIPVSTVVGMVADGMSDAEILAAYPDLEAEDIREDPQRRPEQQSETLLANLPTIEPDLTDGSVAVIEPGRIRVRKLPLIP